MNKRLLIVATACLAAMVGLSLLDRRAMSPTNVAIAPAAGEPGSEAISARAFTLVDAAGKAVGRWRVLDGGEVEFAMLGPGGEPSVRLSSNATEGKIMLADSAGKPRIEMVGATQSDASSIRMLDAEGRVRSEMALDKDGQMKVVLAGQKNSALRLGVTVEGQPFVTMIDGEGKVIWQAPIGVPGAK